MQFIGILRLNKPYNTHEAWNDAVNNTVQLHFNFLQQLHAKGVVKFVGKTEYDVDNPNNFGIVIVEADSLDEALGLFASDPCLQAQVMSIECHPFRQVM